MKIYGKGILLNILLYGLLILAAFFGLQYLWAALQTAIDQFKKAWLGGIGAGPITNAVAAVSNGLDKAANAAGIGSDPHLDQATADRIEYDQQRSLFAKINGISVGDNYAMDAAGWPQIMSWQLGLGLPGQTVIGYFTWGPGIDTSTYLAEAKQ